MHKTKISGIDPFDGALIVFFILIALLIVVALAAPALFGYFGQFDLQTKLHTPKLNDWNVLASGDLYILSYPAVCHISGGLASAVTITCQNNSYVAILADPDYHVSCNASAIYKGWNTARGYYGYAYVYRAKTLSCFIHYPPGGGGVGSIIIIPGVGSSND